RRGWWLGWSVGGLENYGLILVMAVAARQPLPPERLASMPVYMAGLLSATLLGWAVGGVIAGVLTDYIGRRRMLMLSILWYAVFTGLTAVSPGYWFLLVFRFLTGLGLGAEWGPCTTWARWDSPGSSFCGSTTGMRCWRRPPRTASLQVASSP